MKKNSPKVSLLVSVLLMLMGGCASNVAIDYEPEQSFQSFKRFQVITPSKIDSEDTRLNSPLITKRIDQAIVQTLEKRQYRAVPADVDFYVSYILQSKQEILSNNSGLSFGFGRGFGHHSRGGFGMIYTFPDNDVYSYDKAIVTIDILDPKKQLLWRGSSSYVLDISSSPELVTRKIQKIVDEILVKFPPK